MPASALDLIGLGMNPFQANELARQINGTPDATMLVGFGFVPIQAQELVTQINAGSGDALRLVGLGFPPTLANYVATAVVPPLELGSRLVSIGNSIIEYNHDFTATTELNSQSAGGVVYALAQLPRFRHEIKVDAADPLGRNFTGMNQGDAGDTAVGMLARFGDVTAMDPDIIVIEGLTNDITAGATVQQCQDRYTALIDAGLATGKYVIIATVFPRSDWVTPTVQTDPRYAIREEVNQWIKTRTGDKLRIWDPNPDIEDPASREGLGGWPKTGYMDAGGVHPGSQGGYFSSKSLVSVLRGLVKPGTIYDQTVNNLLTNWEMAGTAGARNPTTAGLITGPDGGATQIADTWRVSRGSGNNASAVETSKEADGIYSKQVLAFKPGGSSTFENWELQYFGGNPSPYFARDASIDDGEWVQAFVTLEAAAWDYWGGFNLYLAGRSVTDVIQWQSYGLRFMDRTGQIYAPEAQTLTIATVPFQVTTAMTKFQFAVIAYPKMNIATSNGVLKISRPWFGVVPDPATYWT